MRTLFLLSLPVCLSPLWAQQAYPFTAPGPPASLLVTASSQSPTDYGAYCYWVISVYPIGKSSPSTPSCVNNANTSSGVLVSWVPSAGASGYDVLRTATAFLPPGSSNIAVSTGVSGTTLIDNFAPLSSYTVNSALSASANLYLDNADFTTPQLRLSITGTGGNTAFNLGSPCSSCVVNNAANTASAAMTLDMSASTTPNSFKVPSALIGTTQLKSASSASTTFPVTAGLSIPNATAGNAYLWLSQNADTTKGPFDAVLDTTLFGSTEDEALCIGYNCAPGGGNVLGTEPSFRWKTEQDYFVTPNHFLESYLEYRSADGTVQWRPIFLQFNRSTGLLNDFEINGDNGFSFNTHSGTNWGAITPSQLKILGATGTDSTFTFNAPSSNDVHFSFGARGGTFSLDSTTGPIWNISVNGTTALAAFNSNRVNMGNGPNTFNGGLLNLNLTSARKDNDSDLVITYVTSQTTHAILIKDSSSNTIGLWGGGDLQANVRVAAGNVYGFGNSSTSITLDTALSRCSAGLVCVGTGTSGSSTASVKSASLISAGTTFTMTGCSATSPTGGAAAGTYTSGTTGTCTVVLTINGATGTTAPNGWNCWATDQTTPADIQTQSASSTTTATISGTTVSGDLVRFGCTGF